jgi:hypothetical protein
LLSKSETGFIDGTGDFRNKAALRQGGAYVNGGASSAESRSVNDIAITTAYEIVDSISKECEEIANHPVFISG